MPIPVRLKSGRLLVAAALGAAAVVLSPAIAAGPAKRPPAIALSFDPLTTFTPASRDPALAASLSHGGARISDFRFTPAPAKGRPSQVRVAIRAHSSAPASTKRDALASSSASAVTALTPASYNLGVAVGWRRFAVSGDVAKSDSGNPALGERESAVVGVSYSVKRFTGRVAVGAERSEKKIEPLRQMDNYSLDVGAAYNITRNIAVTGGVRYRIDRERNSLLNDDRRDSQAVYVGTAFKF